MTADGTLQVATDNASLARNRIRDMIRRGDMAEDGRLPTERELCVRFDVSRRAIRRALDALEAEGLIWRRQGKGTYAGVPPDSTVQLVAEIAPDTDPDSVMEARLALEPELAALCARRSTAEDVSRLRNIAARAGQAADSDAAELWDGSLHRQIASIAGNPLLRTAFALINETRSQQRWRRERDEARSSELVAEYDRQHQAIIDAVDARDEDAARRAMRAHLTMLQENLKSARIRRRV